MKLIYTKHAKEQAAARGVKVFHTLPGNARRVGSGVSFSVRPDADNFGAETKDGVLCETEWERYAIRKNREDTCLVITGGNRVLTTFTACVGGGQWSDTFQDKKFRDAIKRRENARDVRFGRRHEPESEYIFDEEDDDDDDFKDSI